MKYAGLRDEFDDLLTGSLSTVAELQSQEDLESNCLSSSKTCLIAFWPHEPEFPESTEAHTTNTNILLALKKSFKKDSSFEVMYVNTIKHGSKLMRDLDVPDMYPVLTAVNHKRSWYRIMRTAFDDASVKSFIEEMQKGLGRNFKLATTDLQLNGNKREEL